MNAEEVLRTYPAQVRKVENDAFDLKQAIEGKRLQLRLREADLAVAIAVELEAAGKKSNAETREAMLRARLQTDGEASNLKRQVVHDEGVLQRMTSTLDFYRDVQRNARVLLLARSPTTILFDGADP